ncbi:MAG: hypothetical protein RLN82_09520, partial [Pseudomonadales bacterium]
MELIGILADSGFPSGFYFNTQSSNDAGELRIDTQRFVVRDGAQVLANTFDQGRAGILVVNASESMELSGTSADGRFSSQLFFDTHGAGDAGNLEINTGQLIIRNGAQISARTFDAGQGGILAINASELVEVSGTSADGQHSSALLLDSRGSGDARGIVIETGRLVVQDGAHITVSGEDSG